jgi:hypothetical protein
MIVPRMVQTATDLIKDESRSQLALDGLSLLEPLFLLPHELIERVLKRESWLKAFLSQAQSFLKLSQVNPLSPSMVLVVVVVVV